MSKWMMLAGLAWTAAMASPAAAGPVLFCKSGVTTPINLVTTGCVSGEARDYPNGGDGLYQNPGDTKEKVEEAIFQATGTAVDLKLYGKSDENPGLFSFSPNATSLSGSWTVLDPGVKIKYLTIKAANSFVLYEIAGAGANSGVYSTLGILNNGGKQPGASHISFWTTASKNEVPEPATWALMIGGFGMAGGAMRRRARATAFA